MKKYKYRAKRGPQETVEGVISAESQDAAIDKINEMGLFPIDVNEEQVAGAPSRTLLAALGRKRGHAREILTLYRYLGRLLKAGVPVLKALQLIEEQLPEGYFRETVKDIHESVRQGHLLSSAMRMHPNTFRSFDVAMIQAGEHSGTLVEVLSRIVEYHEAMNTLRSKILGSLAYPALILAVGIVSMVFMMTHVIPRFVAFFEDLGQDLPLLTRWLITASGFTTRYGLWVVLGLGIGGLVTKKILDHHADKNNIHAWLLGIPFLGTLFLKSETIRLSRTLALLIKSGIPLLGALRIAAPVLINHTLRHDLKQCYDALENGKYFSDGLAQSKYFPLLMRRLVALGEETGRLEDTLLEVADWYENDVNEMIQIATRLLEPIVILAVGLMLGLMIIAVLLPVFSMQTMVVS